MTPLRVAVLLSGSGRTLENILASIERGELDVEVTAVASNKAGVRGLEIAAAAGIGNEVFRRSDFDSRSRRDAAMLDWITRDDPRVLCLCGYVALLDLTHAGGRPVLNIHPALLPRFGGKGYYGNRVHAAVLEAGEARTGATVHLVDEVYDRGPIVDRVEVPVKPGDDVATLAARVFEAECRLYPRVLQKLAHGDLVIENGRPVART